MIAPQLRSAADRLRRSVGGSVSGSLAYTCVCLVTLLYALLLEKMPEQALQRLTQLRDWFG